MERVLEWVIKAARVEGKHKTDRKLKGGRDDGETAANEVYCTWEGEAMEDEELGLNAN